MKFYAVQVAAMAFGLGVSASPSLACRNYNQNPAPEVQPTQAPAYPMGPAVPTGYQPNVKIEATEKPEKAMEEKKPKKTKTKTKTKKVKTTKTKKPKAAKATKVSASGGEEAPQETPKEGGNPKAPKEGGAPEGSYPTTPKETQKEGGKPKAPKETPKEGGAPEGPYPTASPTTGGGYGGSKGSGGGVPDHVGSTVLDAVQTIAAGASFDGQMGMYDRGVSCTGQVEGAGSDAVFNIEAGGSLSNVIIGPNQIEGIHCQGGCTITNVWWTAVCEDAFSIKVQQASETTKIIGGGAFGATDKVVQHNGAGTVDISGFTVGSFGKLYRSCGNCKTSFERHVIMTDITASDGEMLAGINSNFGDTAKITNSKTSGVQDICVTFQGVSKGSEPTIIGSGSDGTNCVYGADVEAA
ncbi:pectate lyase [Drepanopeziza brunnea f. sp. 'multigermtubi' MB_m1]|uniref:Probable pectate lyase F n=1 Tax=Marssonina brunnea f. sp. multigermtubi (strain MB_m1) TaxID=1072389 RepID=K1XD07_MARBU|nr:pectate lyase [Drepanopeziza brunnea f. sp. 'multigermtubi' MB_m1]EKD18648.1 pectate lyase [Drepanopeziza brunnea f. sp. 'multigermtubi' MB_m1]